MATGSGYTDCAPVLSTSSGSVQDDDIIMTKEHKQSLRECRDDLVENMYPDDILNRLQSRKVLTARDVTRVKEKGGIDGMNECLLDILIRKPNRAYTELVCALRESDQSHLANLLDRRDRTPKKVRPSHDQEESPEPMARKRKSAVGVRLQVEEEEDEEEEEETQRKKYKPKEDELTARINDEILETSLIELRNLKQLAKSGVSASNVNARKRIMKTLTQLQRFRREVIGVYEGSTIYWIYCPNVLALDDLWRIWKNGFLEHLFHETFTQELKYDFSNLRFRVEIDLADYMRCRHFLLDSVVYPAKHWCNDEGKDYEFRENTPETSPEETRRITRAYTNMTPLQRFAGKKNVEARGEVCRSNSRRSSSGVSSGGSFPTVCSAESSPLSQSSDPTLNLVEADDQLCKLQQLHLCTDVT